jgi:5-methylcytosine-specific restriction endonuclease McrA
MPMRPDVHRPLGTPTREQAEARRKAFIDQHRPSAAERGYDAAWRACRRRFIEKHPECCADGCGRPTEEVDHIQSVRERPDLRLAWSNLRPYCRHHHSQRTALDQGFARGGGSANF